MKTARPHNCRPWLPGLFLLCWTGIVGAAAPAEPPVSANEEVATLIRQAGNSQDDTQRLELLKSLAAMPQLDTALRSDTEKMVRFVDRWLHDRSLYSWFNGEIASRQDFSFGIAPGSALYPLTCLYRGRMLFWVTNESGNIISYHDVRRRFLDKAVREFRTAQEAFPENRIIRMYLGEPIPVPKQYHAAGDAPDWANYQREGLERLTDIVEWWIEHQRVDGQYGGGWDDDCEMWRSWVPVMIAFDPPTIVDAQARFSRALLDQKYMAGGYTSRMYDVEHTAEPSSDTITPMMHLAPDDPEWRKRAQRIAGLMENVWTGVNERGMLQFKSNYFTARFVDSRPQRACDTPYDVHAVEPALLLWLRTGDEKLGSLFCRWFETWVDATARAERGKPAGILPAAIHWPDGETAGTGQQWFDPQNHEEPTLYIWPSAVSKMTDALLLAYHMTGKETYLEPIRSMAAIRTKWLDHPPEEPPHPGSEAWCAVRLGLLAGTLAKYRLLTGSHEFDAILARDGGLENAESGDRAALVGRLQGVAEAMRVNFPGYTSEVRFTDRVFAFARMYGPDMMFPEAVPDNAKRANVDLLYQTATGDRGNFGVFPLNAVRWLTPPREIAALVTDRGSNQLAAELFHFGQTERPMVAELYLLSSGRYTYQLDNLSDGQPVVAATSFTVSGPRTQINFNLPPKKLCALKVKPSP